MREEAIQRTREQDNAIEAISLHHGTVAISMARSIAGETLARVRFATGLVATINEDGCVIVDRLVCAMP